MQKITPFFWFDKNAEEAMNFYVSVFKNSKILSIDRYPEDETIDEHFKGMAGKVLTGVVEIDGFQMMTLDGGDIFTINPAISLFCSFKTQEEADSVWEELAGGGEVMMEYQEYPWAPRYGWLNDRFGVSWQISVAQPGTETNQTITPQLMFTQDGAGKVHEALEYYTSVFEDSGIDMIAEYEEGEGDTPGLIKHARFHLGGNNFLAMESTGPHKFKFNEAVSLLVTCKDQAEIDYLWSKLSFVPESEQCGWCKDKYGVSWQIIPENFAELMRGSPEATKAMMQMKKIIIKDLVV